MEKLELKHITPYLPYGVAINDKEDIESYGNYWLHHKSHIYRTEDDALSRDLEWCLQYGKPILRPLSDLTKEIEHNGGKFIPIKELWNIAMGEHKSGIDFVKVRDDNSDELFDQANVFYTEQEGKESMMFHYSRKFHRFAIQHLSPTRPVSVGNQLEMFQKLFEWHFDLFGLIPAGLAIKKEDIKKS